MRLPSGRTRPNRLASLPNWSRRREVSAASLAVFPARVAESHGWLKTGKRRRKPAHERPFSPGGEKFPSKSFPGFDTSKNMGYGYSRRGAPPLNTLTDLFSGCSPPPQRPTLLEPLPGPWFPNRGPFSFDPALIPRCPRWWGFFRLAPYRPLAGDATTPITRVGERGVAEAADRFTRIVALRLRGSMAAVHLLLVFQGSLAFRYRGIFRLG
jgi:hypothetical protein